MSETTETETVKSPPKKEKPKGIVVSTVSAGQVEGSKRASFSISDLTAVAKAANGDKVDLISFTGILGTGVDSSKRVYNSPIINDSEPSGMASHVLDSLGARYKVLVPTGEASENYAFYDSKQIDLLRQYPDAVLGDGVKVTRAIFVHQKSELRFAVGIVNVPILKDDQERDLSGGKSVLAQVSDTLLKMGQRHGFDGLPCLVAGNVGGISHEGADKEETLNRIGTVADNSSDFQIYASQGVTAADHEPLTDQGKRKTVKVSDVYFLVFDVKKL